MSRCAESESSRIAVFSFKMSSEPVAHYLLLKLCGIVRMRANRGYLFPVFILFWRKSGAFFKQFAKISSATKIQGFRYLVYCHIAVVEHFFRHLQFYIDSIRDRGTAGVFGEKLTEAALAHMTEL